MVASTLTFSPSSVVVMTAFMVESVRSTPLMYPTRVPKAFLGNPINNNYQSVIKLLELNLKIIPFLQGGDINDFHLFTYLAFSRRSSGGGMTYWNMGSDCKDPFELHPPHNTSHHSGACCRCDCAPGVPPHRSVSRWTKSPTHPTQRPLEKDKDQGQITSC